MNLIILISHARGPDPNNLKTITLNGGKPETIVEGEAEGLRMRRPMETVHYREDDSDPRCAKCGRLAEVWHGSLSRWEAHGMRCVSSANSSLISSPIHALGLNRSWRR